MAAAGLSGAIYKSTGASLPIPVYAFLQCPINLYLAGLRPALVGAGLGIAAAAGWSAFKNFV